MYRRLSKVLFPIVTLFLIGSIVWGYRENQDKNAVLIKAENQYQRAFHDLTYDINALHNELGNALAISGQADASHRKHLLNVWRMTSEAQSNINQLPLTLLPFNKTEDLLARVSKFAYQTAVRDLRVEPLSDHEKKTLKELYKHTEDIAKDLDQVQATVLGENLRWMDVEVALAAQDEPMDNTIIDGFRTVDKKVSEYPDMNWGPSSAKMFDTDNRRKLKGAPASPDQIRQAAAQFMNIDPAVEMQIVENGKGAEYHSYSVSISNGDDGGIQMDLTAVGANPLWFMNQRQVQSAQLDLAEAEDRGIQFLKEHDYPEMRAVNYDAYGNTAAITYAQVENNVIYYPKKITVKVALDNGEIVGFQASDFIYAPDDMKAAKPKLTAAQAQAKLSSEFEVQDTALSVIRNDINELVTCHRFIGKSNGKRYKIYVNALTGVEEKIELIQEVNGQLSPAE